MKKLVFAILIFSGTSFSQILDFLPDGLGLEFGIGHSQMKHQVTYVENYTGPTSLSRNKFNLTPSVRLSYEKELISSFSVMPFISYSINGGKSNKREDGYEDEYILKTLDLGIFAS